MSQLDSVKDNKGGGLRVENEKTPKESENITQESSKSGAPAPPAPMLLRSSCCPICYEEPLDDNDSSTRMIRLEPCDHVFCHGCLSTFCEFSIQEHRSMIISCPAQDCQSALSVEMLQEELLCSEETLEKYRRIRMLHDNPNLVECCSCQSLVTTTTSTTSLCPTCGQSLAAATTSTDAERRRRRRRRRRRATSKSERAIEKLTKPCSHCGVRILHDGGCDHVVCWHCHEDFCWKCGTHVYLTNGKSSTIRNCSSCQQRYLDHRKLSQHRLKSCLWLPISLPLTVIYVILALCIFVASCGCGCFFLCGRVLVDGDDHGDQVKAKRLARLGVKVSLWMVMAPIVQLLNDFGVEIVMMSPPDWVSNDTMNDEQVLDNKDTASSEEEEDDDDSLVSTSFRGDNAV